MRNIDGPAPFAATFGVSRETLEKLDHFVAEIRRWNRAINMVAPTSLPHIWSRHIADSAQLWSLRPPQATSWIDLGSGGGLPGLVIAILSGDTAPQTLTLVESDQRKAAFLSTMARSLNLPIQVLNARAESIQNVSADILTARAFGPLPTLIGLVTQLRSPEGTALLPKGKTYNIELDAALRQWDFDYKLHPSLTDPNAAIVEIGTVHGKR
jgi:16S rRNA (guanine527-N7)-methyltransferase